MAATQAPRASATVDWLEEVPEQMRVHLVERIPQTTFSLHRAIA